MRLTDKIKSAQATFCSCRRTCRTHTAEQSYWHLTEAKLELLTFIIFSISAMISSLGAWTSLVAT
jgi:hypothetical protein